LSKSCCTVPSVTPAADGSLAVCLAGNPNVGKSSLFNHLTGAAVETANYAGMTVGVSGLEVEWDGLHVHVSDLPGTYALGGAGSTGDDQRAAWRHLLVERPDVVVAVLDATNLARNLYVVLQLLDLGFSVVVALNLVDEARRLGREPDTSVLAARLGLPVVTTVGSTGEGTDDLKKAVRELSRSGNGAGEAWHYSADVEARVQALAERLDPRLDDAPLPFGLTPRAAALAVLEGVDDVVCALDLDGLALSPDGWPLRLATERHAAARELADAAVERPRPPQSDRLWRIATAPATGLPILAGVLVSIFVVLFLLGDFLSTLLTRFWEGTLAQGLPGPGPAIESAIHTVAGNGIVADSLLWGLNGGILAALAIGIPYILTFYFMLALLEDSGYMNAAAYLSDRVMHRFGLHGQAVMPLVAAAGCNVPAIIGTRALPTMRERVIASTLAVITPCSARTAVILGSVAVFVGWQWALLVYAIIAVIGLTLGIALNAMLPGEPSALIMEVFPIRRPALRMVWRKTWHRFREFVVLAAPIIVFGSIALGVLYESGAIERMTPVLEPVIGDWLGLPMVAGVTLIIAVLRKELALQMLVVFAAAIYGPAATDLKVFMTGDQIVVYALVAALYIPCLATVAVLARELGKRNAAYVTAGTIVLALLVGGIAARVLALV
jgi:ferrous iron transport protein B